MLLTLFKRAGATAFVLWGAITLLFVAFYILPGDRVDQVIGGERVVSPELRATTAKKLGLDQPILVQYTDYWGRLAHGDLGSSFISGQSVKKILSDATPVSARLAFWAVTVEVIVGLSAGVIAVVVKRKFLRVLIGLWTAAIFAVPVFALGYVLQLGFAVFPFQHAWPSWATLPAQGIGPNSWILGVIPAHEQWRYLVLPVLTLAAVSTAITCRLTRLTFTRVMQRDYIIGARAKGLPEWKVVLRHGLRNALIPVVTFIGLDLAGLFGSAVVTERVFNWPGVGSEIAIALFRQDALVIIGLTIVLVVVYMTVNLVVDFIYPLLDPRVRRGKI